MKEKFDSAGSQTWMAWWWLHSLKGTSIGVSGLIYPTLKIQFSCKYGTVAKGNLHFFIPTFTTHILTFYILSSPIFSRSLSFLLLYVWHSSISLMQLVPASIPWSPSEMCSSKHFMLAYAKGKWQQQVSDRPGTVCAQGCQWQAEPFFLPYCFYLLNNGSVWLEESTGWSINSIHQTAWGGHPKRRTNKASKAACDCNVNYLCKNEIKDSCNGRLHIMQLLLFESFQSTISHMSPDSAGMKLSLSFKVIKTAKGRKRLQWGWANPK